LDETMYDAIVVGARCAGAPTAMLLARQGHRVLLVDRDAFPSDIFRAHFVRLPATRALARWGLLDQVLATGCPPMVRYTTDFDDFSLSGCPSRPDDVPPEIAPRRKTLDPVLVQAAVEAGAELRERVVIEDLLWDDGRVVGARGRSGGGTFEERATIVIGADGQHSLVARKVGAANRQFAPPLTFAYYTYWADVPLEGLVVVQRAEAGRAVIAFPTNDGLSLVAVQGRIDDFAAFRADLEGAYHRGLDLADADDLAMKVRSGRRAERFQGTADLPNFVREGTGPGWVLVGDAGYHRDPLLAMGISDAFRDVEALAEAVDRGLRGEIGLDDALAGYEHERVAAAEAGFTTTVQACALGPMPPEFLALRGRLRGNQAAIDAFYGAQFTATPNEGAGAAGAH
jgi:2-polyprenyl-6-methoxyphenol hydroxylase-like FAD-dependent oxidoreductase